MYRLDLPSYKPNLTSLLKMTDIVNKILFSKNLVQNSRKIDSATCRARSLFLEPMFSLLQ